MYSIRLFEWPTGDPQGLRRAVTEALEAANFGDVVRRQDTSLDLLSPGEFVTLAWGGLGGSVTLEITVGRDYLALHEVLLGLHEPQRLMASTGDEILTVPTRAAEPINCDCLQTVIVIRDSYGGAME